MLVNRATQLQVQLRQAPTLLLAHKSVHQRGALLALVHSAKLQVLQLSRMASVLLPLVIRVQHPTLELAVLIAKKSGHQMALQLTPQHLVNRTRDNQLQDNRTRDSQQLDNPMLGNPTPVSHQLNKVQLSIKTKLSAATQTMTTSGRRGS